MAAMRSSGVAYFSMEFGLGEALPLYAGGLGMLAGDFLKTASDLGIPVIGVGLLYQEGYFRQIIDAAGSQQEAYPYNEPAMLPIEPVRGPTAAGCASASNCPGARFSLRVWQAPVGRVAALSARQQRSSQQPRRIAASPPNSTAAAARCA